VTCAAAGREENGERDETRLRLECGGAGGGRVLGQRSEWRRGGKENLRSRQVI